MEVRMRSLMIKLYLAVLSLAAMRGAAETVRANPWFDEQEYISNYIDLATYVTSLQCSTEKLSLQECRRLTIQKHFVRDGIREGRIGRLALRREALRKYLSLEARSPEAKVGGEANRPEFPGDYRRDFAIGGVLPTTVVVRGPRAGGRFFTFRKISAGETSEQYLQSLVDCLKGKGDLNCPKGPISKVFLPKQYLRFENSQESSSYHLVLRDISDVEIDFSGTTFLFSDPRKRGMILTGKSERVRLRNLVVEWKDDFATPASLRVEEGKIFLQLDERPSGTQPIRDFFGFYDKNERRWDSKQGRTHSVYFPVPLPSDLLRQEISPSVLSNELKAVLAKQSIYPGLARHHAPGKGSVVIDGANVQDVQLERIEVRGSPYMAFCVWRIKRGFLIRDSRITMKEGGFITSASDAMHISEIGGDIAILNNSFTNQADDGINIESHTYPLAISGETLQVLDPRGIGFLGRPGDAAVIYNELMDVVGIGTLSQVRKTSSGEYEVALDSKSNLASVISSGYRIGLLRTYPKRIVISGNRIGNNRGRGILLQGSLALVQRNEIQDTSAGAIKISADSEIFQEGMGAVGILIHQNRIANSNFAGDESTNSRNVAAINIGAEVAASKPMLVTPPELTFLGGTFARYPLFQHIHILDNDFSNNRGASVFIASATEVSVYANRGMAWNSPVNKGIGRRQGMASFAPLTILGATRIRYDAPAVQLWPMADSVLNKN